MDEKRRAGIAWGFIAAGCALVVVLRILSIDLTEGRALVRYLPYWALAAALVAAGAGLLRRSS